MKVQPITTNYSTSMKNLLSSKQKNNVAAQNLSFKGFPIIHESRERVWKITGQQIIDASSSKLKEWAEYLHKKIEIPESIYTVNKDTWWGGEKIDKYHTGVAYGKIRAAVDQVKQSRLTANPEEIARLDKMAEECDEKLTEMADVTRIGGW